MRLLVVDTETGGLDPASSSILSFAAVVWDDGQLVDEMDCFVREPSIEIEPESLDVNRIDVAGLMRDGMPPTEAVARLLRFIARNFAISPSNQVTLVGHNVQFDVGFLRRLFRLANVDYNATFSHRLVDTSSIVQFLILALDLDIAGAGSNVAFERFGVAPHSGTRHTSLGDARATAMLLTKLIEWTKARCGA